MSAAVLLTASPVVFSASGNDFYTNSDSECSDGEVYYFVDTFSGFIYNGVPGDAERVYLTDYPVDRIAACGGYIYASADNTIRKISGDASSDRVFFEYDAVIERFAIRDNYIYFLSGGEITKLNMLTKRTASVLENAGVSDFWFESFDCLSYMTDGQLIFNLDLESGETTSEINFASSYIGDITVFDFGSSDGNSPDALSLSSLQSKFPAGRYWNHMGSSSNNANGTTGTPCNHSSYGTTYCNRPSNGYSASQCHGYAIQCGYDTTGTNAMNWTRYYDSSSVTNVKAGDMIRLSYTNNDHTIYVIAVSGDTVYFTDCNSDGHCIIRWGASKTKSTIKSQFKYLCQNPNNLGDYIPGGSSGKVEYTLGFMLNDDTQSPASCSESSRKIEQGKAYGELPVPVREGYDFTGWYTAASGGTQVTASTVMTGNTSVYAHWQIKVYNITYYANAGSDTVQYIPDNQTKLHFETVELNIQSARTPTRANYSFISWNTRADGSGETYAKNKNYRYSGNADLSLYAIWEGLPRSIYFNANGGSVSVNTISVRYGDAYGELPVPVKTGYKFTGWYNSDGVKVSESTVMTSTSTVSLTAQWDIQKYYIEYSSNGDGVSGVPSTQVKEYNESINLTLTTPSRYGYTFKGWNTKADGSGKTYTSSSSVYSANEDMTLYAQWSPVAVTVIFDSAGGSPSTKTVTAYYGKEIGTLPTATQTGRDLTGWYTPDGEKVTEKTVITTVETVTYYAQWEIAKYTVSYEANNTQVTGMPSSQIRFYGQSGFTLRSNTPSRTGFTFSGWNTQADGSGTAYQPGDGYDGDAHLTLYAIWERDKYTVTYSANSGESAPESQYKYFEINLNLTEILPEKTGYTFTEWNTKADGSGTSYQPGDTYSEDIAITLYAQWEPNIYTVTFDPASGVTDTINAEYTYDTVYGELPAAQRKGHTFNGWYYSGKKINATDTVKITQDCTFTASWSANVYTVTFDAAQGSCDVSSMKITYGTAFENLPPASKEGYIFSGWFTDDGQQITDGTRMNFDSDITLRAAFTPAVYTVTYDFGGGAGETASKTVSYGEPYGELAKAERTGYDFTGWYDSGNRKITAQSVYDTQGNSTLTALWSAKSYTVTFDGLNSSKTVRYGESFGELPSPVQSGKTFCGWYDESGNPVNKNSVFGYDEDITLTARFADTPARNIIAFAADGNITAQVTAGEDFTEPSVPVKAGYSGIWEDYDKTTGGKIVNAVYTPETYNVTWNINGDEILSSYGYGDLITVPGVTVPSGYVLTGWTPSVPSSMPAQNLEFEAVLLPVTYTAAFISMGTTVGKVQYTVDSESIEEPDPVQRTGYTAEWEDYSLDAGGVNIFAVYTPSEYKATLYADGAKVDEVTFTVEDDYLALPAVPSKTGYTGKWGDYTITAGDIRVNAVYIPNKYKIIFIVDGSVYKTVTYTYGAKSINEPDVPAKKWYTASWSPYRLGATDAVSFAEYTPTVYTATFKAHNYERKITFTVETLPITEPPVPTYMGSAGKWEAYEITDSDIVINAVYTLPQINIRNYTQTKKIDYKTTITFRAEINNPAFGGQIHWFINGEDRTPGGRTEYTVSEATSDFDIQVKYLYGGEVISESQIEHVDVNTSFFARIIAFIRNLFTKLPNITQ